MNTDFLIIISQEGMINVENTITISSSTSMIRYIIQQYTHIDPTLSKKKV